MARAWDEKWKQVRRLGPGGQGVTWLVDSINWPGVQGVLKYLKNDKSAAARARMRREVASLSELKTLGANVPGVLDRNTDRAEPGGAEFYLVMEYAPGPTLQEYVANRRLSVPEAIRFSLKLCDTVEIAHRATILHRDIKPDNIIVRDADNADLVMVDFGLSFSENDADVTETNETFRNKFVDLPETNTPNGNMRDHRSDVTALCGLVYFMLTGHKLGHLNDAEGMLPHQRPGLTLADSQVDREMIPQLNQLLDRGLAIPIASRFQSIAEFRQRLEMFEQNMSDVLDVDTRSVAEEIAARFEKYDTKTAVANFRPAAQKIINEMEVAFNQYVQTMPAVFDVSVLDQTPSGSEVKQPTGTVVGPLRVTAKMKHHKPVRDRYYVIRFNEGEFSAAASSTPAAGLPTPGMRPYGLPFSDIAWFAGDVPEFVKSVINDCIRWLGKAFTELAAENMPAPKAGDANVAGSVSAGSGGLGLGGNVNIRGGTGRGGASGGDANIGPGEYRAGDGGHGGKGGDLSIKGGDAE